MKAVYGTDEQETTINIFHKSVSNKAEIFTCIPAMMDRLRTLAADYPNDVAIVEKDMCINATVPSGWIRVSPKRKCNLTDEQKKAGAERLRAYREAKKNASS